MDMVTVRDDGDVELRLRGFGDVFILEPNEARELFDELEAKLNCCPYGCPDCDEIIATGGECPANTASLRRLAAYWARCKAREEAG